jgi:hypothetical protein
VPVVIEDVESTVEVERGARREPSIPEPAQARGALPLDELDFRERYGPLLRAMIREELERYLRSVAD